jgi:hypothetical protein
LSIILVFCDHLKTLMAYGAEASAQIDIKKSQMTSKRLSAALVGRIRGYPCVEEVDNPVN